MLTQDPTTTALTPFTFQDHILSVITDDHGEPWWIAAEVCAALELPNVSQAVSRLDADEKESITSNDALHSELKTVIVNESGLYSLILGSRKKVAKDFKRWVTHEVLPTLRKTGSYALHAPTPAQAAVAIAQAVLAVEQRVDTLEAKVHALQERQPPEGRMNVHQFIKAYSKPYLPREVLDAFKYHCRRTEQPIMFRPDGFDNAFPYYTLGALAQAYEEATRQLSFLAGRRA